MTYTTLFPNLLGMMFIESRLMKSAKFNCMKDVYQHYANHLVTMKRKLNATLMLTYRKKLINSVEYTIEIIVDDITDIYLTINI